MGFFDTKYEKHVGTSIQRAIKDDLLPDAAKTALTNALMTGENIIDHLLAEINGSVAVKLERVYEYAKKNYPIGLPSSYTKNGALGREAAQAVLNTIEGVPVTIEYSRVGPPNMLHIAWMKLYRDYQYNQEHNTLVPPNSDSKYTYYLSDIKQVIRREVTEVNPNGALGTWGTPPQAGNTPSRHLASQVNQGITSNTNMNLRVIGFSPPIVDTRATEDHCLIVCEYKDPAISPYGWEYVGGRPQRTNPMKTVTFSVTTSEYDEDADYFHVSYYVGDVHKYFMYKVGLGTYPTLDNYHNIPQQKGEFFPRIYFRFMKKSMEEVKDTPHYKTSKKMLKMLNMNYADLIDEIHGNPDIKDIETAFLEVAVPSVSKSNIVNRYLFDFFDDMYYRQDYQTNDTRNIFQRFADDPNDWSANNDIGMMDAWMRTGIQHMGITKRRKVGKVCPVGKYTSEEGFEIRSIISQREDSNTGGMVEHITNKRYKTNLYRYQNSSNSYIELTVVGLVMTYWVQNLPAWAMEEDDFGRKKFNVTVPVDREICKDYSAQDKEELYSTGLSFVFNSLIIQKVKWYQGEWFQAIMNGVGLILTFASFGASTGFMAGLNAALAAGTAATINFLFNMLLKQLIYRLVSQALVKLLGPEFGALLGTVLSAISAIGGQFGIKIPMASELIAVGNSLVSVADESIKDMFRSLKAEADEFGLIASIQSDALEQINKEIEANKTSVLNPFVIFGESPEQFFNRTVHSGNIGALGFDAIHNYVDQALTLPKLHQTLGEMDV